MKIIIVGGGKVGLNVAKHLTKENHDVSLIDYKESVVQNAVNTTDVMGFVGNGANYRLLIEAGAKKADLLIASTPSDELNMLCCTIAKKLGIQHTIARVRDPEYVDQLSFLQDDLGFSMAANPEKETASEIAFMLTIPSAIKAEKFAGNRFNIFEVLVNENSLLDGLPVKDFAVKLNLKLLVVAVERDNEEIIPNGNFILRRDDLIHIIATPNQITPFFKKIGMFKDRPKTVLIIGGGRIAHYLAEQLDDLAMNVKIIENDRERCNELSEKLPSAEIIFGDGTNQELLTEEGIDDVDAVVALTGRDEENIIISMYANKKKVDKIITKINTENYYSMLGEVGIYSIVSPKHITVNKILRFVRFLESEEKEGAVKMLYNITGKQIEGLEFNANKDCPLINKQLKSLKIKKDLLIAGIIHDGNAIIPYGDDIIKGGDEVIIVARGHLLQELTDIIEE